MEEEVPLEENSLPKWTCELLTEPRSEKGFTVGEVYEVECEGEPVELGEPLSTEVILGKDKETEEPIFDAYAVKILEPLKVGESSVKLQVTSYRVGRPQEVFLKDSSGQKVILQYPNLKMQTLIQKPDQQMNGLTAPALMKWPVWPLFLGSALGAALFIVLLAVIFRRNQQRRLEKNIKKYLSPLGAYQQFHKDVRNLKRVYTFGSSRNWEKQEKLEFFMSLNKAYRLFLLRHFVVPALEWKSIRSIKYIKKRNKKEFARFEKGLTGAMAELDRAKINLDAMSSNDFGQLTKICSNSVQNIWKSTTGGL